MLRRLVMECRRHAKCRCLEVTRARLELALNAAACEPLAERKRGAGRPPSSSSHPSSPPAGLVSAESSRVQQSAPATGGVRRMRWTMQMNSNALLACFAVQGREIGGFANRARMHRHFADLEPSITVTKQNLADQVRYILRSNIFDVAELERLRREAVPSLGKNAISEVAGP
ncbi:unnamed protein product [Parnassius apollo]|uniref:(apollo) hypothetical protein n=1 Tax=Parnassius apollo TaxID=110799 RepID=A0A8S3Y724_PARAO|nr:unnamed protein product [Parnassius apollo]